MTGTLTTRHLIAEISRWRKANGWTDSSRGWINADSLTEASVAVMVDPDATNVLRMAWRKAGGGWCQPRTYDFQDAQEAIDLLVTFSILPARFSSAYRSGWLMGVLDGGNTKRCENCAPGYDCERGIYTPASVR